MIRFKAISKKYPNGLTWVEYYTEDITKEPWHPAIARLIDLIQVDSKDGWQLIFSNLLSSLKSSAFYPVMTSFSDWETDYSIGDSIIKFHPQMAAITQYYEADISQGKEAGERIYPQRIGKGSRWLFGHQLPRVHGYTKDVLLEMLNTLASLGRAIPISGWESNLGYGEKISIMCEDYSAYLLQAYLLPPSWYILSTLQSRSWLKVLIDADILAAGTLPTPRGFRCVARDGHECNSLVELEIDNWLFTHGVPHEREPLYPRHPSYNPSMRLRADFLVGRTYIEYAGLLDDQDYAMKMKHKRMLAKDNHLHLIVIEPRHIKKLEAILETLP